MTEKDIRNKVRLAVTELQSWFGTAGEQDLYVVANIWEVIFLRLGVLENLCDLNYVSVFKKAQVGDMLTTQGRECVILRATEGNTVTVITNRGEEQIPLTRW